MNWFLCALVCILGWGFADFFYKKGTDERDPYSHLRIAVWVGLVMGVCAFALMPLAETPVTLKALWSNAVRYAPASLCYIVSMVVGYAGLRYLEISIVSPVQNASGALSMIFMLVYFAAAGRIRDLSEAISLPDMIGTALIIPGVILLAVAEQRLSRAEKDLAPEEKKYRFGALALLFPLLYCLFDTLGTAADGIILDEKVGLGLGKIDVIILYGLTFLLAGLLCWIWLWIREKKPYNPFARKERIKGAAACCEEFGQVFYVYAMAKNPVLAAPMVASYCIISVLLGRLLLKEKLKIPQYACVAAVVAGIILLGISEGLSGE